MPPRNHKSPLSPELIYQMKRDTAILKASQDILRVYDEFSAKIDQFNLLISKKFGPKGDKGDKPTFDEVRQHVADLMPSVTNEHLTSLIAPLIPEVKDGEDGDDGLTPQKGTDYMTDEDIEEIAEKASQITQLPEIDHTMILGALNKAGRPIIKPEHIDGLEQLFSKTLDNRGVRGYVHGGGDTVKAGSNISLTRNSDGTTTIATSGGGFTQLAATETPDGNNQIFTFSTATAQPSFIISDNVMMKAVTKSGTVNWTWNSGAKQATLTIPPVDDILGIV